MSTGPSSGPSERIPPHDLHQEEALITTVLCDYSNKTYHRVAHIVSPSHMYSVAHRRIWEAITHVAAEGSIDSVKVAHHLQVSGRLAEIGGIPVITRLTEEIPSIADVEGHARAIRELAQVRTTIATCQRVAAEGYAPRVDQGEWLQGAALAVTKAAEAPAKSSMEPIRSPIRRVFERMQEEARARAEGREIGGLSTGFVHVDRAMGRPRDGELIILAARPGMGKTSYLMNTAVEAALLDDPHELSGVAIFSLEMPVEQLSTRVLASETRQDVRDVFAGNCDMMALDKAGRTVDVPHLMLDSATLRLEDIVAVARRTKLEMESMRGPRGQKVRLRMIGIDYLQLIQVGFERGRNRDQELGVITRALKQLAKELGCVVYLLSQLNRSVEDRPDKRPKLRDLRESGNIEQDADRVMFIYRDEYYNPQSEDRDTAEVIVAKNRNGPSNRMIPLRFEAKCVRFFNLERTDGEEQTYDPKPEPPPLRMVKGSRYPSGKQNHGES